MPAGSRRSSAPHGLRAALTVVVESASRTDDLVPEDSSLILRP